MQSFFAVKNDTSFPVISANIDGKRVFYDIIKGDTSAFIAFPCGSIAFTVYNNFERLIFDAWLSLPPAKRLILSVTDKKIAFI